MLERSARDGVVSIPNETQPRGRGTCALKQPELCAGTQGSGEQREMGWEPLVSCCAQVLRSPRLEEVELWSPRERGRQWRREINNLKDRFSGF